MKLKEVLTAVTLWNIRLSANPITQLATIIGCAAWFGAGLTAEILTNALSIWAIILGLQLIVKMFLDEAASVKRDHAMHAKLDEILKATAGARDDLAHLEDQTLEEIEAKRC